MEPDARSVLRSLPAMIVGEIIIYAFGLTWLALDLHLGAGATLTAGFTPFVAGDAIKARANRIFPTCS